MNSSNSTYDYSVAKGDKHMSTARLCPTAFPGWDNRLETNSLRSRDRKREKLDLFPVADSQWILFCRTKRFSVSVVPLYGSAYA